MLESKLEKFEGILTGKCKLFWRGKFQNFVLFIIYITSVL